MMVKHIMTGSVKNDIIIIICTSNVATNVI